MNKKQLIKNTFRGVFYLFVVLNYDIILTMRENFTIFLDADAILLQGEPTTEQNKESDLGGNVSAAKESVYAVKTLIESLNQAYDITLVILSNWKVDMAKTYVALIDFGLTDVRKVEATRQSTHHIRGLEIKEYLKEKPNNDNYFILANNVADIKQFVNSDKLINLAPNNEPITLEQIEPFLKQINIQTKYPKVKDNKQEEELTMEA